MNFTGKCVGGPLDGQEKTVDGVYLHTVTTRQTLRPVPDVSSLLPMVAFEAIQHVYSWQWDHWKYEGER